MFGIGDIVDIAARLAAAYVTGGTSELMRMAADVGTQVISQTLQQEGVDLPEAAQTALNSYARGFTS
jgi:hypothetical protein